MIWLNWRAWQSAEKSDRRVEGIVFKAHQLGLSLRTAAMKSKNSSRPIQGKPALNGDYEARVLRPDDDHIGPPA